MILVHRLKGEPFVVNADLIETVDASPDTRIRLVDGRTVAVREAPAEIRDLIVEFRAAIIRAADDLRAESRQPSGARAHLTVLEHDEA